MELLIRSPEKNDSESIAQLSNQLGYPTDNNEIEQRLEEILNNKDNCVFVVVENKKIIGWIHGFYTRRVESDSFIEIGGLFVDQQNRKKGVGKMLVEQVMNWTKLSNCSKIRVRCNSKRVESHIFYKNIGFSLSKEQKIFDKEL